jgi:hypothetical protein
MTDGWGTVNILLHFWPSLVPSLLCAPSPGMGCCAVGVEAGPRKFYLFGKRWLVFLFFRCAILCQSASTLSKSSQILRDINLSWGFHDEQL